MLKSARNWICTATALPKSAFASLRTGLIAWRMASTGKPPIHTAQTKQRIVTTVCGKPPKGLSRWSTRTLASKLQLTKSFVHNVLMEYDLHPHRIRTFNFSPDPQFEEKLLEVVGLNMNPPQNAIVLCMDEKTGIQARRCWA